MKTSYIIITVLLTGFVFLATQATSECIIFCQADASQSAFLQIDKNVYLKGDVILLYGSIGNYTQGYNVTAKIFDNQGNIVFTKTTIPKPDSPFLLRMSTNDTNWKTGGPYDLKVWYGSCCYMGERTFIFYADQLLPLKQEEAGMAFGNIKCNSGLVMMMKQEDGAVACVRPSSLQKLISLKWGYDPSEKLTTYGLKDVYHVGQEIDFKFRVNGFGNTCEQPTVTVRNSDQKIVWQSSQYATGCAVGLGMGNMEDEAYLGREPHLGYDYNRYGPLIINQTGTYFMNISWLDGNITKQLTVISPNPSDNNVIINASGGRPLDIMMHVNEIDVNGHAVTNDLPLTLQSGENATLKIEIASKISEPLSLQLRVFNNVGNYPDLAFAHVKFADDVSGLPNGLAASFGDSTVAMNANSSSQETLFLTVGHTTKASSYQIGVLGLTTINSTSGIEMGNSQTLWIPITIK